jgi:hypothetical protein
MSYFRSYFEKNNTLIKDSLVNTSKNPTTEIFYGTGLSRFIFKIDLTDLKAKIDNGDYVVDENTTHTLHLTNCIFGDEGLRGQNRSTGKDRATSFDLILFRINESWDEGVGFDYQDSGFDFTKGNKTYDVRPSNWYNRRTNNTWVNSGVYTDSPDILETIRFDNGNENINVDITAYINGILLADDPNEGIGLAFSLLYEVLDTDVDQSVSFFTKYTQTFYEPFVESYFNDTIIDNRNDFAVNVSQDLYLYVTKGSNFYDLDELPTVDIIDAAGNVIIGLDELFVTKVRKGVYKTSFGIPTNLCDGKKFYLDNWHGLSIDEISIPDVIQKFVPKPYTSQYSIGTNNNQLEKYKVQYFGIKQGEKIKRGEIRKIVVTFKSINLAQSVLFEDAHYRMFIKEGKTDVIVHDWTRIDMTNENSFMFDTSIYIPREYFIEIKGRKHNEEIFYNEYIKFEILSEK